MMRSVICCKMPDAGVALRRTARQRAKFDKEASQTRGYCVAENATHRAARPDPSLRKERLFRMTTKLTSTQGSRYLEVGIGL